jgi:hypothetical protein
MSQDGNHDRSAVQRVPMAASASIAPMVAVTTSTAHTAIHTEAHRLVDKSVSTHALTVSYAVHYIFTIHCMGPRTSAKILPHCEMLVEPLPAVVKPGPHLWHPAELPPTLYVPTSHTTADRMVLPSAPLLDTRPYPASVKHCAWLFAPANSVCRPIGHSLAALLGFRVLSPPRQNFPRSQGWHVLSAASARPGAQSAWEEVVQGVLASRCRMSSTEQLAGCRGGVVR